MQKFLIASLVLVSASLAGLSVAHAQNVETDPAMVGANESLPGYFDELTEADRIAARLRDRMTSNDGDETAKLNDASYYLDQLTQFLLPYAPDQKDHHGDSSVDGQLQMAMGKVIDAQRIIKDKAASPVSRVKDRADAIIGDIERSDSFKAEVRRVDANSPAARATRVLPARKCEKDGDWCLINDARIVSYSVKQISNASCVIGRSYKYNFVNGVINGIKTMNGCRLAYEIVVLK